MHKGSKTSGNALTEQDAMSEATIEARCLIIACGALSREILALRQANGWGWMHIKCLPAKLHNFPAQIPMRVRKEIRKARACGFDNIWLAYADCGTGGRLDVVCQEEGVSRIQGPHCYSFFAGEENFRQISERNPGCFYLTDFLARQFDALIWRGLGLDKHLELLPEYFSGYNKLVYLAQTEDDALTESAKQAAKKLGLAFERRFSGYGELADFFSDVASMINPANNKPIRD